MSVCLLVASCSLPGVNVPKTPQILNVACVSDFDFLEPVGNNPPPAELVRQVFQGLTAYDANLKVVPALASSWEIQAGKMVFHLSQAKFSDGSELEATDVVNSFEKVSQTDASWIVKNVDGFSLFTQGRSASLGGVEIVDNKTISISTTDSPEFFLEKLASPQAVIWKKGEEYPLGTGAFKIKKYTQGSKVILAPNPNSPIKSNIEQINFFIRSSYESAFEDFRQGRVHIAPLGSDLVDDAGKEALCNVVSFDNPTWILAGFNCKSAAFKELSNRTAVFSAIDTNELNKTVWGGLQTPVSWTTKSPDTTYKGKSFSVAVPAGLGDQLAKVLDEQLQKNLGVKAAIEKLDAQSFNDSLLNGKADMFVFGLMANTADVYEILSIPVANAVFSGGLGYDTGKLMACLTQKNANLPREDLLKQAKDILTGDLPFFPIVGLKSYFAVSTDISGFTPAPFGGFELGNCIIGR